MWAPDGKQLAVINRFRGIRLLDVTDLREILIIPNSDLAGMVEQVEFSPDGRQLAFRIGNGLTGTRENFDIHLWDLWTHEPIAVLPGYLIEFSPDGRWLATAADETSLHIWSTATGEEIAALDHHTDWIRTIAFSPNNTLMASVDLAGTTHLWNMQNFQVIATLEGTPDYGPSLQFSSSGNLLVVNTASDLAANGLPELPTGGFSRFGTFALPTILHPILRTKTIPSIRSSSVLTSNSLRFCRRLAYLPNQAMTIS